MCPWQVTGSTAGLLLWRRVCSRGYYKTPRLWGSQGFFWPCHWVKYFVTGYSTWQIAQQWLHSTVWIPWAGSFPLVVCSSHPAVLIPGALVVHPPSLPILRITHVEFCVKIFILSGCALKGKLSLAVPDFVQPQLLLVYSIIPGSHMETSSVAPFMQ